MSPKFDQEIVGTPLAEIDAAEFNSITNHLTLAELGAFHRLCGAILETPNLALPANDYAIRDALNCDALEWGTVKDAVLPLFETDPNHVVIRLKPGMFTMSGAD